MKQFITIQVKSDPVTWGTEGTWSTFVQCFAEISFPTGAESVVEGQPQSKNSGTARIRYNPGVRPKMRIYYPDTFTTDRYFEIESIMNVKEQNREMIMIITEVNR